MNTILVEIAAYRDDELPKTIASCLANAANAERLRFAIVHQFGPETDGQLAQYHHDDRFTIIERDWRPGFMVSLQQKDLRLVLDAADDLGVPLVGTAMIFNLYRTLERMDLGHEGNHALIKALEHLAGFEVGAKPAE